MKENKVHFLWQDPSLLRGFRTGVSLHGHTMHSQECLWFLPRYLKQVPGGSQILRRYPSADFSRAYWTPPLSPASALLLERGQIGKFGLQPLVSLTDHDGIEAPIALQVTANRSEVPVSVEWTVPYRSTFLHLGIHNLPSQNERSWMKDLRAYTSDPAVGRLHELLASLHQMPEVLIVLNHLFWREEGVDEAEHLSALAEFLRTCVQWIHAFELNGTRPWKESAATIALARDNQRPLISGGDRHACEPNACLNLTSAQSFSEFVQEVRDGNSTILFLPQYRELPGVRILEAIWDILRPYPEYPGRERWTDRVFYTGEDGVARPLSAVWQDQAPWYLDQATGILQVLAMPQLRTAMRLVLGQRGDVLP